MSGIEVIGLIASCGTLAEWAGKAAKCIHNFIEGGVRYNEAVHELESKLITLQHTLKLCSDVAERVAASESEKKEDEMSAISVLKENVVHSGKTLQGLFSSWGSLKEHENRKTLMRAVEFWCYGHDGKKIVDRGLKEIDNRVGSMKLALQCIDIYRLEDIRMTISRSSSAYSTNSADTASIAPSDDSITICDPAEYQWNLEPIMDKDFFTDTGLSCTLIFAIQKKERSAVRSLLDRGDDPLAEDANGWCALHYAVRADSKRVMRELIGSEKIKNSEGGIDRKDKNGATALHFAASIGRKTMAYELLEAKADKDALDHHERSPLLMAVEGNHRSVVGLLVGRGAKVPEKMPKRLKEMLAAISYEKHMAAKGKKY